MTMRVERAFFHSGFLNAGTPLEMASTPVMAAPPEAKACRTRKMPTAPSRPPWSGDGDVALGDRRGAEAGRSPP